jgi:hypothetical protein
MLNKLLEEIQKKKPFNYDIVFGENNEINKQNTLFQVKLKALSMEEKYVDLWGDVVLDIVQKDIGKIYKKYERNERLYRHKISQMEKFMPSFEYELLILSLKPKASDEEEDRGDTYGA